MELLPVCQTYDVSVLIIRYLVTIATYYNGLLLLICSSGGHNLVIFSHMIFETKSQKEREGDFLIYTVK